MSLRISNWRTESKEWRRWEGGGKADMGQGGGEGYGRGEKGIVRVYVKVCKDA